MIHEYCDQNGDETVDACEVYECIVASENEWRTEHCPEYGLLYCETPFNCAVCENAWDCSQIEDIAVEVIAYYDSNYDGTINPADTLDETHYEFLVDSCDMNNDGTIDACEVHVCIVQCENAWRAEFCPEYGAAYCPCPFELTECYGAWDCM